MLPCEMPCAGLPGFLSVPSAVCWPAPPQGSKYASRLPIGLEKVIREVPAEVVRGFYRRWYVPSNLAVVIVGDFDCDKVVQVRGVGIGLLLMTMACTLLLAGDHGGWCRWDCGCGNRPWDVAVMLVGCVACGWPVTRHGWCGLAHCRQQHLHPSWCMPVSPTGGCQSDWSA